MLRIALLTASFSLLLVGATRAEIYRFTDSEGNLHFTQDLSRVPPDQRDRARREPSGGDGGTLQTYSPPASPEPRDSASGSDAIRVPFERSGTLMWVDALVNDRHRVPFLIDTGASGVSLPSAVVTDLGILIRADTPRVTVGTANGAIRVPLVELESIALGDARVERLQATVNPSMAVGLLGGSFFNNYTYSVDTAASVITLVPNDRVRGGAAADQWRERFLVLRSSIERLEKHLSDRAISRPNRRRELEANLAALKEDLVDLELEANRARVPKAWRQ